MSCLMLHCHPSMGLAGVCLFSECGIEGVSIEGQADLEEYLQLLDDMKHRCAVLQHDLQDYTDALVHRCSFIMFGCVLLWTTYIYSKYISGPDAVTMHATCHNTK